jgi:hypothetical protein
VITPKALDRFKQRIREITRRGKRRQHGDDDGGVGPVYMRGWRSYFGFCETPEVLIGLTRWVRLRLRAAMWRQWKTPGRRRAALLELGVRPRWQVIPLAVGLAPGTSRRLKPLSGPVRTVVWQGSAGDRRPDADQSLLSFRFPSASAMTPFPTARPSDQRCSLWLALWRTQSPISSEYNA